MSNSEEISDILADAAYKAKDEAGNYRFKKGTVLKFDYEGTLTSLKITRIMRGKQRAWAEHVTLVDVDTGMSHYGHNVDLTQEPAFCEDCQVPLTEKATEAGETIYQRRQEEDDARTTKQTTEGDATPSQAKKGPKRRPGGAAGQLQEDSSGTGL